MPSKHSQMIHSQKINPVGVAHKIKESRKRMELSESLKQTIKV